MLRGQQMGLLGPFPGGGPGRGRAGAGFWRECLTREQRGIVNGVGSSEEGQQGWRGWGAGLL